MNKRVILSLSAFLPLLIATSVLAGCNTVLPMSESPTVPPTVALALTSSPSPSATIHATVAPATSTLTPEPSSTPTPPATNTLTPEPSPTLTPSVSPTQRRLNLPGAVYLHFPPKTKYDEVEYPYRGNLYQVDPNTGQISLLLTGDVQDFTISPDGGQLAYVLPGAEGNQLILRNLADGKDRTLFAGEKLILQPAWSPDGRELVFNQYTNELDWWRTGELWVVGIHEQNAHKVADGFDPAWSPDSQKLAYATRPRIGPYEQNSLEVVDRLGKKRQIVFNTDSQTWKVDQHIDLRPKYGKALLLYSPSWSSDGRYLLFSVHAEPESLYQIQLDSGAMLKLTSGHLGLEGQFVAGSDRVIALVSEGQGWITLYSFVVTKQGEIKRRYLNQNGDVVTCFALSPDRWYVAFVATDQEWSQITFVVYDLVAEEELLRRELFGDIGKPHAVGCGLEWAPQ